MSEAQFAEESLKIFAFVRDNPGLTREEVADHFRSWIPNIGHRIGQLGRRDYGLITIDDEDRLYPKPKQEIEIGKPIRNQQSDDLFLLTTVRQGKTSVPEIFRERQLTVRITVVDEIPDICRVGISPTTNAADVMWYPPSSAKTLHVRMGNFEPSSEMEIVSEKYLVIVNSRHITFCKPRSGEVFAVYWE